MPKETKSNKATVEQRITHIFQLLTLGLRRAEILEYVNDKTNWGVSESQIAEYMRRANKEMKKLGQIKRSNEITKALCKYDVLYRNAYSIKDYKTCLNILQGRIKLLGLDAPKVIKKKIDKTITSKETALKYVEEKFNELKDKGKQES